MKLVLQEFVSLDGVSQGPGAPDEDTSGGFTRGGWFVPFIDERFIEIIKDWVGRADAFLFGRKTYQNFARDWPKMDNPDDPVATALNHLPKYVATRTSVDAGWNPTTVLAHQVEEKVAELKRQAGRELQIHGSAELGYSLLSAGLVDELRLVVAPVIVGQGRRLLPADGPAIGLRPLRREETPGGLSIQIFEPSGAPDFGTYGAT
ncbi:MAG: dihydrofolate reductase family protein [Rhodospirillales bacterium]|nr:dihydrofolate reductase family protein [Rhodospirillales bacterium]